MKKTLCTMALGAFSVTVASAQVIIDTDFTSTDDVAFTEGGSLNNGAFWSGDGDAITTDITGSGIVQSNQFDAVVYLTAGVNMAVNDVFTFTFDHSSASTNNNHENLMVGLGLAAGDDVTVGANIYSNSVWKFNANGVSGGSGDPGTVATDVTQVNNQFQTTTVTITKSATADQFNITADMEGNTLGAFSTTITNSDMYADTDVYVTIRIDENDRTVGTLDSFTFTKSVVPEPSAYAIIGGSFALGFAMMRRRQG